MGKISQYASQATVALTDYLLGNDSTGPTTKRFTLSNILTLFLNNIPASEGGFAFVSSGLVWTGDSYETTRAGSMTAGRVRVNSTFLSISAVTARVFTASRDTYIDVLDNLDGTGTLVYTEVTNNSASPALASNSVRIGIVVTGASSIANVGSINQGEPGKVLPIASSIPYMTTDSLGNLICPRDPNREILGYTERATGQSTTSTSLTDATGLSMVIKIPANCYKIKFETEATVSNDTSTATGILAVTDSSNNVQVQRHVITGQANANALQHIDIKREISVTPETTYTFKLRFSTSSGTVVLNQGDGSTSPTVFIVSRK